MSETDETNQLLTETSTTEAKPNDFNIWITPENIQILRIYKEYLRKYNGLPPAGSMGYASNGITPLFIPDFIYNYLTE